MRQNKNKIPREAPADQAAPRSRHAKAIERLKKAAFRAADERQIVPQPLFWSLLFGELRAIKRDKQAQDLLRRMLDGAEID